MESNKFKLTRIALALAIPLSIVGCGSDNNKKVDPPVITPPTQVVETPPVAAPAQAGGISITVTDATGALLASTVEATISFVSETNLLNSVGTALTDADKTTAASLFGFTVSEVPAAGITYKFTVSAPGHLSNTLEVTLDANATSATKQIALTPTNFTGTDVAIVVSTQTLADAAGENVTVAYDAVNGIELTGADKITVTQTVAEALSDTAVGGTSVSINTGTQFIDAAGNALATAPTLTVGYYANDATAAAADKASANSSLNSFPGGMSQAGGSFSTLGSAAIELVDETGVMVKTFGEGNALDAALKVDKNTSNPCPVSFNGDIADLTTFAEANGFTAGVCSLENAQARDVAANDVYPVWSYEAATDWTFEGYSLITDSANATTFDLAMKVDHLSTWNASQFVKSSCDSVTLNFPNNTAPVNVILSANSYLQVITSAEFNGDYSKIKIDNPLSFEGKLRVTAGGAIIANQEFTNLCDLNNENVTLVNVPGTVEQTIITSLVCNENSVDVPAAPVVTPTTVLILQGTDVISQAYVPTGTTTVKLLDGITYSVAVQNPGTNEWIASEFTAANTTLDLSIPRACATTDLPITGTGGG